MSKKKVILSYGKVSSDTEKEIAAKFPFGFENHLIDMRTADGSPYKALLVETDDIIYLIKFSDKELRTLKRRWNGEEELQEDASIDLGDSMDGLGEELMD